MNSALVVYTDISPMKNSPRNHTIDTITIHHMAGNLTVESCGALFKKKKGSSNYGIGSDGRIACFVDEKDRAWTSSNGTNDNRAVTIEVANTTEGVKNQTWEVSDKAMESLIALVTDICKRNNIPKLIWDSKKENRINHTNGANMTIHKDFAATACPGPYLESRMSYIADEVNKRLGATPVTQPTTKKLYRVQVGAFSVKANADKLLADLKSKGYDGFIVEV